MPAKNQQLTKEQRQLRAVELIVSIAIRILEKKRNNVAVSEQKK
jgi:hypothetical protein